MLIQSRIKIISILMNITQKGMQHNNSITELRQAKTERLIKEMLRASKKIDENQDVTFQWQYAFLFLENPGNSRTVLRMILSRQLQQLN